MDRRRADRYDRIYEQLRGLIEGGSPSLVAAMATICAVLHAKMPHHSWTGFYLASDGGALHVGPYQGAVACQVLAGGGVCLRAAEERRAVVVPDVDAFPGHIACDPRSKSEIAVPVIKEGEVVAVLDIDAAESDRFTDDDVPSLVQILRLLDPFF